MGGEVHGEARTCPEQARDKAAQGQEGSSGRGCHCCCCPTTLAAIKSAKRAASGSASDSTAAQKPAKKKPKTQQPSAQSTSTPAPAATPPAATPGGAGGRVRALDAPGSVRRLAMIEEFGAESVAAVERLQARCRDAGRPGAVRLVGADGLHRVAAARRRRFHRRLDLRASGREVSRDFPFMVILRRRLRLARIRPTN